MTISVAQTSFVGGEWAPSLYARTDLARYGTAVRKMKNVFAHPHGGASNRPGTQFVIEVKDSSKFTRLIPFQFSVVQSYVLEFGEGYMRVLKDGGAVSLSTGPATYAGGTTYDHGDHVEYSAVNYYSLVGSNIGNTPDVSPDEWYALTGSIVEIETPYLETELNIIKFTQSADVLYITHPNHAPMKLSRSAHDTWVLEEVAFAAGVAAPTGVTLSGAANWYVVTTVSEEGEESVASSSDEGAPGNNMTWNSVTEAEYYNIYKDSNNSGTFGWIGQATSTSFKEPSAGINPDFTRTPPGSKNPFNATDDYPGAVTFFEQRLVFARTNNRPQTLWGSVVGSFENMNKSSPLRDDDSYDFTINAKQVNEVRWMVPINELIIGTSGSEWKMSAGGNSDAVTPTSVNMKITSQWGVSHLPPIIIGNTVLFTEGSGDVVRDLIYSLELDGYSGSDLSVMAHHLLRNYSIVSWSYQQHPDSIIWCVRDDGGLIGLTYFKEHEVWGWHQHETDGSFESVTTISTAEGVEETYFVINRTIEGSTKRYVERFLPRLPFNDYYGHDIQDAYFVDCGLSLDSPITITGATKADPVVITAVAHGLADGDIVDINDVVGMTELNVNRYKVANKTDDTFELTDTSDADIDGTGFTDYVSGGKVRDTVTVLSGLDHLEGKEVVALANGNVMKNLTVASGSVTLPNPASRVHIGLPYTSDIETLDYEFQTETGTVQDKRREITSVMLRLDKTRGLWVGPDETRLNEVAFREDEEYGDPTNLFSGDKELNIEAGNYLEGRLFFRNTDPVPMTLLAVIARMDAGED